MSKIKMTKEQALDILHDYIAVQAKPSSKACKAKRAAILAQMIPAESWQTPNDLFMEFLDAELHWYADKINLALSGKGGNSEVFLSEQRLRERYRLFIHRIRWSTQDARLPETLFMRPDLRKRIIAMPSYPFVAVRWNDAIKAIVVEE